MPRFQFDGTWFSLHLIVLKQSQINNILNTHLLPHPRLAFKYLVQSWTMIHSNSTHPPVTEKHPHAFFKHKAKKIFLNFEKVFSLYPVGLHIVTSKSS